MSPPDSTHDSLKKDVRHFADDAMHPARQLDVDSVIEASRQARNYARDAMHETKDCLTQEFTRAEHFASGQYDRTIQWITENPLRAVGMAFVVGLVFPSFLGSSKR